MTETKSINQKLETLVDIVDEKLRDSGLHQRFRAVSKIEDQRERISERTRHGRVKYDLENFNYSVKQYLRELNHSRELLQKFDYLEINYPQCP